MSIPGFLFDEQVPSSILGAILSLEPSVYVECVGQAGAPHKGTLDPDLIDYCFGKKLVIVTNDKSTMVDHANDHLLAGIVTITNERASPGRIAADLLLIWVVTDETYWSDYFEYIPF